MPTCRPVSHAQKHGGEETCTCRQAHGCGNCTDTHTQILGCRIKIHKVTHAHQCDIHTHTHRLWVSQHWLFMSGDTGWLITLCTDGHTGGRKGEEQSCPVSLSIHPTFSLSLSHLLSMLSLSLLVSVDPHTLSLCSMNDLWVAHCRGWLEWMTFHPSTLNVFHEMLKQTHTQAIMLSPIGSKCLKHT